MLVRYGGAGITQKCFGLKWVKVNYLVASFLQEVWREDENLNKNKYHVICLPTASCLLHTAFCLPSMSYV